MANPGAATTVTPSAVAVMATQNVPPGALSNQIPAGDSQYRLLGRLIGANANVTTDQAIPIQNALKYSVAAVVYTNASLSMTTASGGVYAAAGKTTAIVSNAALSGLTGATKVVLPSIADTDKLTGSNVYFALTTAQGAASTVDVYVYGYDLSAS